MSAFVSPRLRGPFGLKGFEGGERYFSYSYQAAKITRCAFCCCLSERCCFRKVASSSMYKMFRQLLPRSQFLTIKGKGGTSSRPGQHYCQPKSKRVGLCPICDLTIWTDTDILHYKACQSEPHKIFLDTVKLLSTPLPSSRLPAQATSSPLQPTALKLALQSTSSPRTPTYIARHLDTQHAHRLWPRH